MQRNRVVVWSTILLTTALVLGASTLAIPADWPRNYVDFHQQLIANIIMAGTHTGAAILLLINLDVYKARLRRAYIVLSLGTLVTGIGTLQISVLTLLGAWQTPYGSSGATMLPFVLSGLLIYLGVRSFARLTGLHNSLTRLPLVLIGVAFLVAVSTLLPHVSNPRIEESVNDVLVGISMWSSSLIIIASLLAWRIREQVGALYQSAMKWLAIALLGSGLVLLFQVIQTLTTDGSELTVYSISNLMIIISGALWIRAGYSFALTKYYSEDISIFKMLFGGSDALLNRPTNVIDMVTHAASLVSNTADIDPLLDTVRTITSRLAPGEKPSVEDDRELIRVYFKIEQYLITQEAIRNYTRLELRAQLDPALAKQVAAHEVAPEH